MVVTYVLQKTPILVTVFVMIMMSVLYSRRDIAVFSRILTAFCLLACTHYCRHKSKKCRYEQIRPLLDGLKEVQLNHFVSGILMAASLFRPAQALQSTVISMASAGLLYLMVIYSTLAVFGVEEIKKSLWPTLELAKTVAQPNFYIERMDPIFLAVCVTSVFCAIYASYYMLVLPTHSFIYRETPQNIYSMYRIDQFIGIAGICLTLGLPVLLLLAHFFKSRGKATHRHQEGLA